MITNTLLGGLIGSAIAFVVGAVIMVLSKDWWIGCAASLALALAVWRHTIASVMNRSSSASDAIELGWDDLLRFRQVRGITASTAWASAAIVYLIDCAMSSPSVQLQWWLIILPIGVCFLLACVFRQGRRLWRQAWLERDDL